MGASAQTIARHQIDGRAHCFKALDVLIDGTYAKIAAAGHGHTGPAKPAQFRADEIIRGADPVYQFNGCDSVSDSAAVDLDGIWAKPPDIGAHIAENLQKKPHIRDIRNIFNFANAVDKQGRRNDGDRGVFCTR